MKKSKMESFKIQLCLDYKINLISIKRVSLEEIDSKCRILSSAARLVMPQSSK